MQVVLEFVFDKKFFYSVDDALFFLQEILLDYNISALPYFENDSLYLIISTDLLDDVKKALCSLVNLNLKSEKIIEEIDWVKNLKDNFNDLNFESFNILSSIKKEEILKLEKENIFIEAGTGFGTGHHPTTYMLLSIIANNKYFFEKSKNILDLGCGSAILAIVISKLYNKEVLGIDNDELALQNAKYNIELNDAKLVTLSLANKIPENFLFDTIFANLFSELLIKFSDDFYKSLKTGGKLLVSGILNEQVDEVRSEFKDKNLKEIISKNKTDENSNTWHALVFEK